MYPGAMAVMIADNGTFEDIAFFFENIIVEDIDGGKVFCAHFRRRLGVRRTLWTMGPEHDPARRRLYRYAGDSELDQRTQRRGQWTDGRRRPGTYRQANGAPVTDGSGPHLEINGYVRNVTFE